jgi:hypothetical protein
VTTVHSLKNFLKRQSVFTKALSILAFVVVGSVFLMISRAATPSIAVEPEKGTLTAPAKTLADASASGASAVQFAGSTTTTPPPTTTGSVFTFASLPDTQRETWNATVKQRFDNRMNWLVQNKTALNLAYVWQVGDLEDWDTPDHALYQNASSAVKILENAKIPVALVPGNHDTGAVCAGGSACPGANTSVEVRNTTTWNSFYPPSRFPGIVTMESGKTDNAYRRFSAGGLNWLLINYELWPRTTVVNWMKTVIAQYPHDNVILITHSHLEANSVISTSNGGYGANSPQYVFDQVIKQYPNIRFVFSGHTGTSGYREDTGVNGNKIYEFLDCYHSETSNPMRLLTVDTTKNTITTKVYQPWTNDYLTGTGASVSLSNIQWVR